METWIASAALGAVAFLVGVARFVRANRPERRDERLPATPLERLGWIGIWVTASVGTGLAVIVAYVGPEGFHEDRVSRLLFWLMLMVGLGVWALAWRRLSRATGHAVVDERDRAILARSFSVESAVVIVSLVAWTVGLTEANWETGSVPLGYLQLLFWSTFILGAFGRSLGIVLGYRREPLVDA